MTAALRYAALGYPVFPCVPSGKAPLTEHGFHDATTEVEQIERWWGQHPTANVAIATAGLLVVDLDPAEVCGRGVREQRRMVEQEPGDAVQDGPREQEQAQVQVRAADEVHDPPGKWSPLRNGLRGYARRLGRRF
jgi:hypothetical protein